MWGCSLDLLGTVRYKLCNKIKSNKTSLQYNPKGYQQFLSIQATGGP